MPSSEDEFWERARRARDKLTNSLFGWPEVSLIDIGYDPQAGAEKKDIVLRVHLRKPPDKEKPGIPPEIDGIPVRIIFADYKFE